MASPSHQSYAVKSEQDLSQSYCQAFATLERPTQLSHCSSQSPFLHSTTLNSQLEQEEQQQVVVASNDLPITDTDLAGFLDMDDKTLTELTGVNTVEWNSLFNGQLDDVNSLDPMTGIQNSMQADSPLVASNHASPSCMGPMPVNQPSEIDRWLIEETQKLERQQKMQQQKLMELQQTLLKTEILKNQLQIASISQSSQVQSTTTASLLASTAQQNNTHLSTSTTNANGTKANFNFTPTIGSTGTSAGSVPSPKVPSEFKFQPNMTTSPPSSVSSGESKMSSPREASDMMIDVKPFKQDLSLPPSPFSPSTHNPESPELEPSKRKVHNLIEKKYRCSINDRICTLRDIVTKHSKDNKKLQKSAVLQKTIDYIYHLKNSVKKLQEENQQLREALAVATGKTRVPSFSSPPNTPSGTLSSSESEIDSGHPSSPDDYNSDGQMSHGGSPLMKAAFFNQYLHNPIRQNSASQYLMVVMLVAVLFVNPLTISGPGSSFRMMSHSTGSSRTLNTYGTNFETDIEEGNFSVDSFVYAGVWMLRILVAALCFGWMTLKSIPKVMANSQDAVNFWRFRKQAEEDLQKGEFTSAKDNLEIALSVINQPIPTSYFGIIIGLLWNFFMHTLFQLVIGRCAVYLASTLVRNKKGKETAFESPKKPVIGVTFDDVSKVYHLLHQIKLSCPSTSQLRGMGFYLGLNALNFAEADRPFQRLSEQQMAEMYFTMGLQCHYSIPLASSAPMWYYFFCFRNMSPGKHATPLKWAVTQPGKSFLMSAKWSSEVGIGSKLYIGNAALPLYSITRAYCKELLCETFSHLLLPDDAQSVPASRDNDAALQAFKFTLNLAKEANACLLNGECVEKNIRAAAGCSDSGFTVVQWWASVGIVSCYWLAGKDQCAEDYYSNIEALSGEMGAAVPSALLLSFKANRMYKRPRNASRVPLEVVLQLCATTSNSLEGSVANLQQDHTSSTENELHRLGLLQACDWLLGLKVTLWENHGSEDGISRDICPGFYQDVETLSKLVTLLPSARSRLHLYKGCYQLIAGANPIAAHAMLNITGSASLIRRRTNSKEENSAVCSPEHAMAKVMAYKHLPPSMEVPQNLPPTPTKRSFGLAPDSNQAHV